MAEKPQEKSPEKSEEKPKSRIFLRILGVLLIGTIAAGWFFLNFRSQHKLAPPPDGRTFAAFSALMPPPKHLAVVEQGEQKSIIWIGEHAAFPAVPAGPSCYQFDLAGNLVDWCPDTGDGNRLDQLARAALRQQTSAVEDVAKLIKPEAQKPAETATK
jgi:hypothetical protein